ncbi:hypothetical protein Bca52824_022121 [Brassica carinata]|uniref:Uncharacterized protein n=1 Tax=Brassica carinata TaxID=52824 RepID=A0A8X7VG43_BRACI|nr:hypothetical protein Bca52824_022121 [Brassica carinata]
MLNKKVTGGSDFRGHLKEEIGVNLRRRGQTPPVCDAAAGDGVVGGDRADGGEGSSETTKAELPEELEKSVVILTCESTGKSGSCDVCLTGTAHASKESCREVQAVISILKPEQVTDDCRLSSWSCVQAVFLFSNLRL